MKAAKALLLVGCVSFAGCATVNMADLESSAQMASKTSSDNVVVKASEQLQTRFKAEGWVEPASMQMKQAASILLKGRDKTPFLTAAEKYATAATTMSLKTDIMTATDLAGQTLKAADVYLQYADETANLSADLRSLEQALLTCRSAENTFKFTSDAKSADVDTELTQMSVTLSALQTTTDNYGDLVRGEIITGAPVN